MLDDLEVLATVAVRDLQQARQFYEGKLGLKPSEGAEPSTMTYRIGGTSLLIYASPYAGTNKATAVTWSVGTRIEALAKDLAAAGIVFEHYQMPGMTLDGDVHVSETMKVAWFKDPDGNIHALAGA